MNAKELDKIKDQIFFYIEGMNKILITSDIQLPDKIKKSKNKNYGNTNFYDARELKELDKNFQSNTDFQTKRVFLTDWVFKAVKVGKIKIAPNSNLKNMRNGEYVSLSAVKEVIEKNIKGEHFGDFKEEFFIFLKQSSQLKLKEGKMGKETSRYISLKEKKMNKFARNVELYFAKYAFPMPNDSYIHIEELQQFLTCYLKKKCKKELPSVVVRSNLSDFEVVKKIKELNIQKHVPKTNFWKVEKKFLPSVVVRNLNLDFPFYRKMVSDKVRSSSIVKLQENKKPRLKKRTIMPILLASAITLLSGTAYNKPSSFDVHNTTVVQSVNYEVSKFHTEPIMETKESQELNALSKYVIGGKIELKEGTHLYASSDHNYGGSSKYGALKGDITSSIDRIVLLKGGKIVLNEQMKGKNVLDCLDAYDNDCEVIFHVEQGWVDLNDIKQSFNIKTIGSRMVMDGTIRGEVDPYNGKCDLEDEKVDISNMSIGEVKTFNGTSYMLKEFDISEREEVHVTTCYTEGHWDWNLKNISKKKALLLESLGLLSSVLWARKYKEATKQVNERHDLRLK